MNLLSFAPTIVTQDVTTNPALANAWAVLETHYNKERYKMTTIVMKEMKNDVAIGYDSQVTGYSKTELGQGKVFVNNGVVYGVAGRLLMANEIRHAHMPTPPPVGTPVSEVDRWVTTKLAPKLRSLVRDVSGPSDHYMSVGLLMAVNGRVYEVSSDSAWIRRTDGTYAIGSGSPYAFGVVASGGSIHDGLKMAANADPYTGGTLHLTTASKMLAQSE